jgi:hypothetical protein
MMGGGNCPYEHQCDKEAEERWKRAEEKRLLDLEEQKARIELMKQQAEALKRPLVSREGE